MQLSRQKKFIRLAGNVFAASFLSLLILLSTNCSKRIQPTDASESGQQTEQSSSESSSEESTGYEFHQNTEAEQNTSTKYSAGYTGSSSAMSTSASQTQASSAVTTKAGTKTNTETSESILKTDMDRELRAQQADLDIIWEVCPYANDAMSTNDQNTALSYSMIGQMVYLPRTGSSATNLLYRLLGGSDHMVSVLTQEGDHTLEGPVGNAWKKAFAPIGTARLIRGYNSSKKDYAFMSSRNILSGYSQESMPDDYYGYHRFGTNTESLYTLKGSEITISSNLVAGGILWNWIWNGKQFIDTLDYGRQIQSSLSFRDSVALPTEGGDNKELENFQTSHGSPILSYSNNITDSSKTQSTRAIPLEWNNEQFNGNDTKKPVIYPEWYLGKDISLDMSSLNLGSGFEYLKNRVTKYSTVLYTPKGLTGATIEIPTGYMLSEFDRAFTYDATVTDLTAATHEVQNSEFSNISTGVFHYGYADFNSGGVIYATSDLNYAMGVYGSKPESGGSVSYFTLWKFGILNNPDVTKWSACYAPARISAGEVKYNTYIICGAFDDVRVAMRRLYLMGYK